MGSSVIWTVYWMCLCELFDVIGVVGGFSVRVCVFLYKEIAIGRLASELSHH